MSPVSCLRSSQHCAADVGDKQATENKELVSCLRSSQHYAADVGDKQATRSRMHSRPSHTHTARKCGARGETKPVTNRECHLSEFGRNRYGGC
jgi:hypothetical protein